MITKDFGFMILFRLYLLCFLMKTAITIPLKKSRKRKINVFLRGSCFQRGCFFVGTEKRRQLPAAEIKYHVMSNITKDPRRTVTLVYWAWCRVSWLL